MAPDLPARNARMVVSGYGHGVWKLCQDKLPCPELSELLLCAFVLAKKKFTGRTGGRGAHGPSPRGGIGSLGQGGYWENSDGTGCWTF